MANKEYYLDLIYRLEASYGKMPDNEHREQICVQMDKARKDAGKAGASIGEIMMAQARGSRVAQKSFAEKSSNPARSESQQKLFGIALAMKRGEVPRSYSREAARLARSMSERKLREFAMNKNPKKGNIYRTLAAKYVDTRPDPMSGNMADYIYEYYLEHDPGRYPPFLFRRMMYKNDELRENVPLDEGHSFKEVVDKIRWEDSLVKAQKYGLVKKAWDKIEKANEARRMKAWNEQIADKESKGKYRDAIESMGGKAGLKKQDIVIQQFDGKKTMPGYYVGKGLGIAWKKDNPYRGYTVTHLNSGLALGRTQPTLKHATTLARLLGDISDWSKYQSVDDIPASVKDKTTEMMRKFANERLNPMRSRNPYAMFDNFEFKLTKADADSVSRPGPADQAVSALMRKPYVFRQLKKISDEKLREELREYGAWSEEELQDRHDNEARIVWIAGGNIMEELPRKERDKLRGRNPRKTETPKYRLEIKERGVRITPMSWKVKEYGSANNTNLAKWVKAYIDSMKPGGVNAHLSKSAGYLPVPDSAKIIEQKTGRTVAEWKAPMFMAINPSKEWHKNQLASLNKEMIEHTPQSATQVAKLQGRIEQERFDLSSYSVGRSGKGRNRSNNPSIDKMPANELLKLHQNYTKLINDDRGELTTSTLGMLLNRVNQIEDELESRGEKLPSRKPVGYNPVSSNPKVNLEGKYLSSQLQSNPSMTPSELKYQHEKHQPDSYYFTRDTMNFFGDRMSNYGVRSAGDYWELYRKRPVKHGLKKSSYFDKNTFKVVHGVGQE